MKAIETKFLAPTNTKGPRIKAIASPGNSITLNWNQNLDVEENHIFAAKVLIQKLNWQANEYVTAWLVNGSAVHCAVVLPWKVGAK